MEKKVNIPMLRFPEFNGEWEKKKLGDIGDVKMCRRIFNDQTSIEGDIPFFKIGSFGKVADAFITKELYIEYREKFSYPKKGNVLISAAGTIGRLVVYNGEDAYYQDSNIIWIENDETLVTDKYLFYILQIVKFKTEGGTIQRLYNNILKSTKFSCSTLKEQTKIASFLTAVDDKLQALKKKKQLLEQYKKGVMQKIFLQELRFKDDNGNDYPDLEEKKLGEVLQIQGGFAFKSNHFNRGNTKVIRIGDINYRIEISNFNGTTSVEKPDLKYCVKKNDFVMALSGATFGKVGKIVDNGEAFINQRVALFKTTYCLEFFFHLVQSDSFRNYIVSIPTASAQPNISNNDILNYESLIPTVEEQTKIANFLSAIDDKINAVEVQIEKMEVWKKGLLQQMFC